MKGVVLQFYDARGTERIANIDWVNYLATPTSPRFSVTNSRASVFPSNSLMYPTETIGLNFASKFTLYCWAKCVRHFRQIVRNKLIFHFATTTLSFDIPKDLDNMEWHQLLITRTSDLKLSIYFGDQLLFEDIQQGEVNFEEDSYVYLGNPYEGSTGFDWAIDNFVLAEAELISANFITPILILEG